MLAGALTLITGGTIIHTRTVGPGETRGDSIEGGASQTLGVGDVVIVPAGVPHQLLIPPGAVYKSMVAKIKES